MLQFNSIQNSSDLTTFNAKQKIEINARVAEEKHTLASNLVSDFLTSIMDDTLANHNPKELYEYEVNPNVDVKSLRVNIDEIIYNLFKNNMYAVPDIFCKESSEANPVGKILVHAANTVKYITSTDIKLEREVSDLLHDNIDVLRTNNAIVYTGFDHMVSQLPNAYATTRCQMVMKLLEKKGYKTKWEPVSMYLTITIM